jgi:bifunctional DNA-binding transcriptional regulator/antitoxin component of YhaV-PrlF toxin-antitoxin module
MASVTLSSKFQLFIPKAIREEMRGVLKGADTSNYRDRTDRLERY